MTTREAARSLQRYWGRASRAASLPPSYTTTRDRTWRRYLNLQAQAKTGLSYGPLVWGGLTLVFGALAFVWIIVSAFIWLAERYGPLVAALALTGFFLLIAVVVLGYCIHVRRRTIAHAELELAARSGATWIDPKLLGGAIQAGRAIGLRRAAPALALGVLAFGLGMHWPGRDGPAIERDEEKWRSRSCRSGAVRRLDRQEARRRMRPRALPWHQLKP